MTKNKKLPKLIIQIPAYNEEQTIGNLIRAIPKKIQGIKEIKILVADDGSRDNTINESKKAGADYFMIHKYNQGLGKNFKHAIEKCLELKADIIVNIDADGQFNPKDIPKLIQPILDNNADMVTCSRFLIPRLTKNMPAARKWGNKKFTNLVSKITGKRFTDTQCGFRAYSKEAALRLNLHGRFTYTQEVFLDLAEKGIKIIEIPLPVIYHKKRKSILTSNLINYGLRSLGIITRTTRDARPLTFFGVPATIIFTLGFIGGIYSLIFWLLYQMTKPIQTIFNISIFFMVFGISLGIFALLADMIKSIKRNQDEMLYRLKKQETR